MRPRRLTFTDTNDVEILPFKSCVLGDPAYLITSEGHGKINTPSLSKSTLSSVIDYIKQGENSLPGTPCPHFRFFMALYTMDHTPGSKGVIGQRLHDELKRQGIVDPAHYVADGLDGLMNETSVDVYPSVLHARILLWAAIQLIRADFGEGLVPVLATFCELAIFSFNGTEGNLLGLASGFSRIPSAVRDTSNIIALFWARSDFLRLVLAAVEVVSVKYQWPECNGRMPVADAIAHATQMIASTLQTIHSGSPTTSLARSLADPIWSPQELQLAITEFQEALIPPTAGSMVLDAGEYQRVVNLRQLGAMGIARSAVSSIYLMTGGLSGRVTLPESALAHAVLILHDEHVVPSLVRLSAHHCKALYSAANRLGESSSVTVMCRLLEAITETDPAGWDYVQAPVHLSTLRLAGDRPQPARGTLLQQLYQLLCCVPRRRRSFLVSRPHSDLERLDLSWSDDRDTWTAYAAKCVESGKFRNSIIQLAPAICG